MLATCSHLRGQWNGVTEIEVLPIYEWQKKANIETSDGAAVLRMSRAAAFRPPSAKFEQVHLQAAEKGVEQVFSFGVGDLVGVTTFSNQEGDVFAARWKTSSGIAESGITEITVWDAPEYNFFILDCTQQMFESQSAAKASVKRILQWKRKYPYLPSVRITYGHVNDRLRLGGTGFLAPGYEFGSEFDILAIEDSTGISLVFKIAKAPFAFFYPDESVYVPERFPPLRERIATWSRNQILSEIGRMWSERGSIQAYPNRDRILIREALVRGVSESELQAILLPQAPRPEFLLTRVGTTIRILASLNKVGSYRELIARSMLERGRSRGGSRIADYLFTGLLNYRAEDFTREALECVATCVYPEGAFIYLQERGTEETVRALEESPVTPPLHEKREATVERLRRRLDRERENRR
jgi:hypothetical protein